MFAHVGVVWCAIGQMSPMQPSERQISLAAHLELVRPGRYRTADGDGRPSGRASMRGRYRASSSGSDVFDSFQVLRLARILSLLVSSQAHRVAFTRFPT